MGEAQGATDHPQCSTAGLPFTANLFQRVESRQSPRKIVYVTEVANPRLATDAHVERLEREEGVVAVRHVTVLSAKQESSHDLVRLVTVTDHCATSPHTAHHCIVSIQQQQQ